MARVEVPERVGGCRVRVEVVGGVGAWGGAEVVEDRVGEEGGGVGLCGVVGGFCVGGRRWGVSVVLLGGPIGGRNGVRDGGSMEHGMTGAGWGAGGFNFSSDDSWDVGHTSKTQGRYIGCWRRTIIA